MLVLHAQCQGCNIRESTVYAQQRRQDLVVDEQHIRFKTVQEKLSDYLLFGQLNKTKSLPC
jgi:hypothetical protein